MRLRRAFCRWRRWFGGRRAADRGRAAPPRVEGLEDRLVPAGFFNDAYVSSLFQGLLGRAPDQGGLAFWSNQLSAGASAAQVAQGIIGSPEYHAREVVDAFQEILNRNPDPASLSFFTNALGGGTTIEQVKADLYGSDEFFALSGGSNAQWLNAVFARELGRTADTTAAMLLPGGTSTAAQRTAVALIVLNSPEAQQFRVANDFRAVLNREPDPMGLSFWTSFLANGGSDQNVLAGLLGSGEYLQHLSTAVGQAGSTDPVVVGTTFALNTNRIAGSLQGVPPPFTNTANTSTFTSFTITTAGLPFGPLRFPASAVGPLVPQIMLPGFGASTAFAPGTQPITTAFNSTQFVTGTVSGSFNGATQPLVAATTPGFGSTIGSFPPSTTGFVSTTPILQTGTAAGFTPGFSTTVITPGFSSLVTTPTTLPGAQGF